MAAAAYGFVSFSPAFGPIAGSIAPQMYVDSLPGAQIPVRGRFVDGVGTFTSTQVVAGKPSATRFIWSKITRTSAQWEQALSEDGGKTWTTNWIMEFRRR